jgi:hypothetical protein
MDGRIFSEEFGSKRLLDVLNALYNNIEKIRMVMPFTLKFLADVWSRKFYEGENRESILA